MGADREMAMAAVMSDGKALRFVDRSLLADREIAWAAVQQNGWALTSVARDIVDYDLCLAAVRKTPAVLQRVDDRFKEQVAKATGLKLPTTGEAHNAAAFPKLEFKKKEKEDKFSKVKKHYTTLGLDVNASPEDIRKRYRQLALQNHPDKHPEDVAGAKRNFQLINNAYRAVKDHLGI